MERLKMSNTRAFPLTYTDSFSGEEVSNYGMTLRDYFAAKAMQAIVNDPETQMSYEEIAIRAFEYAEAMLAVRNK
jgi:capsule polysaccharide modification protein KpsS